MSGADKNVDELLREVSRLRELLAETDQRASLHGDLIHASAQPILVASPDGRFLLCNEAFAGLTGYTRQELVNGREAAEGLTPPEHREGDRTAFEELLRTGRPVRHRKEYLRKDGARIRVELLTHLRRDQAGEPQCFSFVTDISALKRDPEALREREDKYRHLFEVVSDSLHLVNVEDGRLIEVNQAACQLYGYSREEMLGLTIMDLSTEPDQTFQAIRKMKHYIPMRLHKRKDGSVFPVEIMAQNFLWHGSWVRISSIRDVTARVETERSLKAAKEAAEKANRAKSEFLANMTHEIRTPMNGLLGMLQILQTTHLDSEQADYLNVAARSGKRLTELLGDILDLSRIEAGKLFFREAPFSFQDIYHSLNDIFLPSCLQGGITLALTLHPSARGKVVGDETRVRQVLFNLVSNAVKFSSGGEVRVLVSCLPAARPGHVWAIIEARDHGIGIPEDRLDTIFTSFSQVDGDYTRRFQGAGLGLAIVKKLVEMMSGSINIESGVGAGTLVETALLLKAPAGTHELDATPLERHAVPARQGPRVLLVEDEDVSRTAMRLFLEKLGCHPTEASDARQAIEILEAREFDLILMDIQLPVLDGLAATRIIRDQARFGPKADVPIIAMTAYAMAGDKERFLAAGIDDYLSKPVAMGDLNVVLERVMAKRPGQGGALPGPSGPAPAS